MGTPKFKMGYVM